LCRPQTPRFERFARAPAFRRLRKRQQQEARGHTMADAAGKESRRALKIKCGAVLRLHKEIGFYEAEAAKEAAKVDKMRADNACPHDVKQQARVRAWVRDRWCCISALCICVV
jgi:hypothetical protein